MLLAFSAVFWSQLPKRGIWEVGLGDLQRSFATPMTL